MFEATATGIVRLERLLESRFFFMPVVSAVERLPRTGSCGDGHVAVRGPANRKISATRVHTCSALSARRAASERPSLEAMRPLGELKNY